MSIAKTYSPAEAEEKWYSYWLQHNFFRSVPDEREPYTIVIPPPNVTGVLHMGHMLNNTIQDVLIRRARMKGKNACWVPGTDHASIATEAKVVAMLKERGINKKDLSREEFLSYAWEWKEKYGGIILDQLKKLGASCDWERTKFTMDEDMSESVIDYFVHLHKKGLIYRGVRMVNWDPQGKTAVSDEEVIRKEVNQKLYYIKYPLLGTKTAKDVNHTGEQIDYVLIATTRPETIMADAAICVNPNDPRYVDLIGRQVRIPLIDRLIPIIADEYVTMDFGTGCLKVTPAHDLNDYELGQKHKLQIIDILNDDATLNEKAQILIGEDRFIARKKIAVLLEEAGALEKTEDYTSQIGYSERTNAAIEPKLSMQWFCKMSELATPAMSDILDMSVNLIPDKFTNSYMHWMQNVRDWNISRQLWWGQQIPAYYLPNGEFVVAKTKEEALVEAQKIDASFTIDNLTQDEDVLDTWFSSGLWPISVFDGVRNPDNAEINYYYPTNDLVTAPEILFFWVARMIMAGHELRETKPFTNVYLTGIVRDKLGRKMSKSLGNSPDPLDLIAKYGADGVRVGMLLCSPAGNDLMFDESYCEQGRNFSNKIWNAFKLVKGWEIDESIAPKNQIAIEWFESRFNQALVDIESDFKQYRLSEALMTTYKLVWDDFCAWYLEMVKPAYQQDVEKQKIDAETYKATVAFFENILKVLHPYMPFLTEELWHDELFGTRAELDCCIVAQLPTIGEINTRLVAEIEVIQQVIAQVRNTRNSNQLSPKEALPLAVKTTSGIDYLAYEGVIKQLGNISELSTVTDAVAGANSFIAGTDEFFIKLDIEIDVAAETERLNKEKEYLEGFLKSVNAKLNNERFMANAKPEIIDNELKKKADAEVRLKIVEDNLRVLAG
ncbi:MULTISPECIES: valine--tRNA ligase [unclassified Mucilaginibacter]|uniref:valine--tRNA ligase n=1 Tax=unclassified Mucilaginibacter TaxID=2617802 RepID=UPI002AC8A77D|nr:MULTISPECIES: valine--tRNA ligase [unclassified Mucilaginibacter]MEB0262523.1 valine--tRNA ligase [Mucilaginibacter sp. 10I4]MEB0277988.1 valine--tRNA ligase [Mucilaginibacter sp. 10B2]MEB0299659.1 valine--tRNA ligase [Mucilaginibacter sp. 5C4]WPX22877.1 valine--tRNA ligase [Mucilaginibacter sp. 5C4]